MSTLLERAKKIPHAKPMRGNKEQMERAELALAVLNGEITNKQATEALGCDCRVTTSSINNYVGIGLRYGWIKAEFVGDSVANQPVAVPKKGRVA